uniref:RNase H type-1 domain-containing protein n=1 Tax=Cannabis sativa TaxID=3483 RepID=A0A803R8X2_CANSA
MFSIFAIIVQDCQSLLLSLPNVKVHFVKQSTNRLADVIARFSRSFSDHTICETNAPAIMLDILYFKC